MNLIDDVRKTVLNISKNAHKTFNTTKYDLKIMKYNKKCDEAYLRMGKFIYQCKENNKSVTSERLSEFFREIDHYKERIKEIQDLIKEIKKQCVQEEKESEKEYTFEKLTKKDHDLKIFRTNEGIKFVRVGCEDTTQNDEQAKENTEVDKK